MRTTVQKYTCKSIMYLFLSLCFLLGSCKKDKDEYDGVEKTTHWIEKVMRQNYYWNEDIPEESKLNFLSTPETFFGSLLSGEDGKGSKKYSTMKDISKKTTRSISQTDYSYGFDFVLHYKKGTSYLMAHVLYVAPESPAAKAGLKRGDWITEWNGNNLTITNYKSLYGGAACSLKTGYWNKDEGTITIRPGQVSIDAAQKVEDNPVHYYTVIRRSGKRIGYLVYNHFTPGKNDTDNTYDNLLREISTTVFKANNVNEFILDLRYNNGGSVSSAQLLCALLAPSSVLGKSLGHLEYNNGRKKDVAADNSLLKNGSNLNLNTLYILTTSTTASASEFIINSLTPYMNVVMIGEQTEGKNVGSLTYSDNVQWELHPIVCKVFNSRNLSDYANGFKPDYSISESSEASMSNFLDFGNEEETLLSAALSLIDGTYSSSRSIATRSSNEIGEPFINSLDRKATNGVVVGD